MDYSPYYFRREKREKRAGDEAAYRRTGYSAGRGRKAKKGVRIEVVLVVAIFLCLVTALVLANVWSGEKIIAAITSAFKDKDVYEYYAVAVGEYADEREAVVQATVIRAGGGAGYIFEQGNTYFVALATYLSKDEAEAVCEKNEGAFVYEVKADLNALYDASSDDAAISRTVGDVAAAIKELSERSADYAANEASAADTLNAVTAVRNDLYATKEYLYSVKADAKLTDALLGLVEPVFQGTEAVIMDNHSDELAAAMRYIVTSGVFALRALCAAH